VGAYPLYDCTITVNCTGGGNSCSATIPITVDNASCDPVTFDGYVQACCEEEGSLEGRLPFSVIFTPNPNCKGYTITCVGPVGVASLVITNAGSGYVAGATIPVTITGGGGAGATANAIIGDGGVSDQAGSTTVAPLGAGYVNGTYNNVPAVTLTGVGVGALFTVVVAGGQVVSADVVPGSNGTGYNVGDTITFNAANLGGSGAGVVVTINTINTGMVQNIVVTAAGTGYTSQATATIPASGGGITATAVVVMETCPTIDVDTCGATPVTTVNTPPLGTTFVACNTAPYSLPAEYTVVQDSCCYECTTITFNKPGAYDPSSTVYYQDCETGQLVKTVLAGGGSVGPVCAINGSWFVVESDPVNGVTNIVVGAACP
jgi:hypothetical protein